MKVNISRDALVAGVFITGLTAAVIGIIKLAYDTSKLDAEEREKLQKYKDSILDERDYKSLIKEASLLNKKLDSHQRSIVNDILDDMYYRAVDAKTLSDFDKAIDSLDDNIDIFLSDDENAMLAVIDRRIQREAYCQIQAERDHELAMAKALGEKDVSIAKIAANAETGKARLYSEGIKGAAEILKEVRDERKQESDD